MTEGCGKGILTLKGRPRKQLVNLPTVYNAGDWVWAVGPFVDQALNFVSTCRPRNRGLKGTWVPSSRVNSPHLCSEETSILSLQPISKL